jgi:uncharacterized protein YndB with AHSA1/START domain/DNA-binding transcriptional ArsR family regulator
VSDDVDLVFKALADRTRRHLLDRLHESNGQTLGELCDRLDMTRQAATQHLGILEKANLVSTLRRGRQKLHYLNPVPLHTIQERWIDKFERPRLRSLSALKQRAENAMTVKPSFVYVVYIESTPENVWHALTDADVSGAYWGHHNISDWQAGSPWEHRRTDGSGVADVVGTVEVSEPPRRLVTTWAEPGGAQADLGSGSESGSGSGSPVEPEASRVTFDIEPFGEIVRLTVTHEDLKDEAERNEAAKGWAAVLSNLKSLLETGSPLPREPWLVP